MDYNWSMFVYIDSQEVQQYNIEVEWKKSILSFIVSLIEGGESLFVTRKHSVTTELFRVSF